MFRFERLQVWHKAVELYEVVDKALKVFPATESFGTVDQLRRAALSISSNIAEGSGRETGRESAHFYTMARASAYEVVSIITVCQRRGLVANEQYRDVYGRAEEISKMLTALKRVPTSD